MKAVFIALNRFASVGIRESGVAALFNVPVEDVTVEELKTYTSEKSPFQRLASIYCAADFFSDIEPKQFITVRGVDQIAANFMRKYRKYIGLAVTGNSTMLDNKRLTLNSFRSRLRYIDIIDSTSPHAADQKDLDNIRAWLAELTPSYKILHCPSDPFSKFMP